MATSRPWPTLRHLGTCLFDGPRVRGCAWGCARWTRSTGSEVRRVPRRRPRREGAPGCGTTTTRVVALAPDPDGAAAGQARSCWTACTIICAASPGADAVDLHPIDAAGRLTQEDWCVHRPTGRAPGGWWRRRLASRPVGTLVEKIGRTIRRDPLAGTASTRRSCRSDGPPLRTADAARPGCVCLNWNLLDDATLHQPHVLVRGDAAGDVLVRWGGRCGCGSSARSLRKLPDHEGDRVLDPDPPGSVAIAPR